jgi:hypothetical protein
MSKVTNHLSAAILLTLATVFNVYAIQPESVPTNIPNSSASTPQTGSSVLEHFRSYTGQRTPDALLRLFSNPVVGDNVKQKPNMALSDGQTQVELTLKISSPDNSAPNFACIEASLISVKQTAAGIWQVILLPNAGTWKAAVVIQQGSISRTVPLTVAPPLSGDLSMNGFTAYLKESQADEKQRIDLNGDGKLDYQDDYVLAVNVLATRDAAQHDPATRNKRARELTPVRPKP